MHPQAYAHRQAEAYKRIEAAAEHLAELLDVTPIKTNIKGRHNQRIRRLKEAEATADFLEEVIEATKTRPISATDATDVIAEIQAELQAVNGIGPKTAAEAAAIVDAVLAEHAEQDGEDGPAESEPEQGDTEEPEEQAEEPDAEQAPPNKAPTPEDLDLPGPAMGLPGED